MYEKNFVENGKVVIDRAFLTEFIGSDYKTVVANSKTYSQLYHYLKNDVFGICQKGDKLFLKPNTKKPFKICLNFNGEEKQIYFGMEENKSQLIYLKNISIIDLNSLKKPAVVCF